MLFERFEYEGLAHYSYLIGDQREALVIDPRRDCEVYAERAHGEGMRIKHILETHRNEDYVIGSLELAHRTDAEIWHADRQLDYRYGQPVEDGQTWKVGRLELAAIHSPGHTPGSMSYLLRDRGGEPWMVFTGDALFASDEQDWASGHDGPRGVSKGGRCGQDHPPERSSPLRRASSVRAVHGKRRRSVVVGPASRHRAARRGQVRAVLGSGE